MPEPAVDPFSEGIAQLVAEEHHDVRPVFLEEPHHLLHGFQTTRHGLPTPFPEEAQGGYSIQNDHVHLIIIIPRKYSVSRIIGKIKANTSRELKDRIEEVRKIYCGNEFWSPGFFSSTVGINEEAIKRYVEF